MRITITKRYAFEAGHFLPNVPEGHKCRRQHGHNYEVEVSVTGGVDGYTGMVMDFFDLDRLVDPLVAQLDHRNLNDIDGLKNPTAENIAWWFYKQISLASRVRVYETKDCWADVVE